MKLNANDFKIRCYAIGQIMSEPKNKADKEAGLLGETAKNYCESWLKEQIYSRKKEIPSKYLSKGILCESVGIELINDIYVTFYSKNEAYFENDFITGTPDIVGPDKIIDIKNPYDYTTFPIFETEIPNKDYIYQLQGYMKLTGKLKAKLIYTLTNIPDELIEMELNKLRLEFTEENAKMFKYDDVDMRYRIKSFDLDFDQSIIDKVEQQVIKCRKYIQCLIDNL